MIKEIRLSKFSYWDFSISAHRFAEVGEVLHRVRGTFSILCHGRHPTVYANIALVALDSNDTTHSKLYDELFSRTRGEKPLSDIVVKVEKKRYSWRVLSFTVDGIRNEKHNHDYTKKNKIYGLF